MLDEELNHWADASILQRDDRNRPRRNLVLVRPDQHVAWRGDEEPAAPLDLIDLVRGARIMPAPKAS